MFCELTKYIVLDVCKCGLSGVTSFVNNSGFTFSEFGYIRASTSKVICCHFSSDGKLLASGGHDKKVNNHLFKTSCQWWSYFVIIYSLPLGFVKLIYHIFFYPFSRADFIFDVNCEMQAVLWHTDSLKPKSTLEEHSLLITDVRFSPSMPRLATSSFDKTVRVWDADNVSNFATLLFLRCLKMFVNFVSSCLSSFYNI